MRFLFAERDKYSIKEEIIQPEKNRASTHKLKTLRHIYKIIADESSRVRVNQKWIRSNRICMKRERLFNVYELAAFSIYLQSSYTNDSRRIYISQLEYIM